MSNSGSGRPWLCSGGGRDDDATSEVDMEDGVEAVSNGGEDLL